MRHALISACRAMEKWFLVTVTEVGEKQPSPPLPSLQRHLQGCSGVQGIPRGQERLHNCSLKAWKAEAGGLQFKASLCIPARTCIHPPHPTPTTQDLLLIDRSPFTFESYPRLPWALNSAYHTLSHHCDAACRGLGRRITSLSQSELTT